MLIPGTADLKVYRTGTYETTIQLWEDAAHTVPFKLTNWEVEVLLQGGPTLKEGSGLTVVKTEGKIEVILTPAQTEEMREGGKLKYWVKIKKTTGNKEVWFPLAGVMTFELP